MYSVHNKSPNPLNSWLSEVCDTGYEDTPLRRLFITKNGNQLEQARDNSDAILTIFFDSTITLLKNNPTSVKIKSNVAVVHPLGPFHKSKDPEMEGWMKVSIVKVSQVDDIIPASLARILFENNEGSVQKITNSNTLDADNAKENEVTRQFAYAIIASGSDIRNNFYAVEQNTDLIVKGDKHKENTPIVHVYSHTKGLQKDNSTEETEE